MRSRVAVIRKLPLVLAYIAIAIGGLDPATFNTYSTLASWRIVTGGTESANPVGDSTPGHGSRQERRETQPSAADQPDDPQPVPTDPQSVDQLSSPIDRYALNIPLCEAPVVTHSPASFDQAPSVRPALRAPPAR